MSEPQSALAGATFDGAISVREAGPVGMIIVRGDLSDSAFTKAVADVLGLSIPETRGITTATDRSLCWMSPDELLLILPHDEAPAAEERLAAALAEHHALVVNVSDARALFHLSGPTVREVIAKVAPVDMAPGAFGPGTLRRSRIAQVPAAFWMTEAGDIHVICFRSVAQYVFDVLKTGAAPGAEVGVF